MSGTGIGRFVGRERRLAAAERAFGTLPPQQRRALALRYVSGLSPDDIAARLGVGLGEVDTLLATGRSELLRTPRRPYVRPLALTAVAAAVVLAALPTAPSFVQIPGSGAPEPVAAAPVVGGEALLVTGGLAVAAPAAGSGTLGDASLRASGASAFAQGGNHRGSRPPRRTCRALCVSENPRGDVFAVSVPEPVSGPVGQKELVLEQEHVRVCKAVPTAPPPGARCVPGSG